MKSGLPFKNRSRANLHAEGRGGQSLHELFVLVFLEAPRVAELGQLYSDRKSVV